MTDKVLCPWCGAEMRVCIDVQSVFNYITWMKCTNNKCTADGPLVTGYETVEEAEEAARAALRCYTPPLKPMTLKEIKAAKVVWIEDPEVDYEKELYPAIYWGVGNVEWAVFIADIDDGNEQGWYYMPDYGKLWRAWERKPTDEERSAAEWET